MFKFTLEPVLDHRKTLEEERQREMAQAAARVRSIEEEQSELRYKVEENLRFLYEAISKHQAPAQRSLFEGWIDWAKGEIERLSGELLKAQAEAEKKRTTLADAARDTMIMKELKIREKKSHDQAEALIEQGFYDDLAIREFDRRRREAKFSPSAERNA